MKKQTYIDYLGVYKGQEVHARSYGISTDFWLTDTASSYMLCSVHITMYNRVKRKDRLFFFIALLNDTAARAFVFTSSSNKKGR